MTHIFYPELQIAAGFNNAAGLVAIESITAPGDTRPFVAPSHWFNYNPGEFKLLLNQKRYIRGDPSSALIFSLFTRNQWVHFSDTYCAGGYEGEITIRTRLRDPNVYLNANSIVYLPPPSDTMNRLGFIGGPFKLTLVAVEEI